MLGPVYYVFKKELIEITRSNVIRLLIFAPLFQMIVFGYVATTDIRHVEMMVCDEDSSASSRLLTGKFCNNEYFDLMRFSRDPEEINNIFNHNLAKIALRIQKDFSKKIKRGDTVQVQLIIDGSDPNMSSIALNRATSIIRSYSDEIFAENIVMMKTVVGNLPSVSMEERVWYNPQLKSANTMVPGVIGLILMIITILATSISLVREKESGNIEQLMVTTIKPYQIIAGKILPYVFIAILDIILITVLSILVFGISFEGSFTLLVTLSIFMILTNLGIGIFISTISATQQQAMLSDIFFILPNMLLSGFIFPIKNMPEIFQFITYFIPLRYYMVIIRGVFLKGLSFAELLPQIAALFIFGVIIFGISILKLHKKLA